MPVPTFCKHLHSDYTAKVTEVASLLQVPAATRYGFMRKVAHLKAMLVHAAPLVDTSSHSAGVD